MFEDLACALRLGGYWLRSGGAEGADSAFELGASFMKPGTGRHGRARIFRADDATPMAIEMARRHHPCWGLCDTYARRLHGRNAMIILGPELNEPVKFVLCWTPDEEKGGTALGIRIARARGIPVVNFAR
jgi:hypothetical protein